MLSKLHNTVSVTKVSIGKMGTIVLSQKIAMTVMSIMIIKCLAFCLSSKSSILSSYIVNEFGFSPISDVQMLNFSEDTHHSREY